jgi:hypothetical protein
MALDLAHSVIPPAAGKAWWQPPPAAWEALPAEEVATFSARFGIARAPNNGCNAKETSS